MKTIRDYLKIVSFGVLLASLAFVLAPVMEVQAQYTLKPIVSNSFQVNCTSSKAIAVSSATTTELVALVAGTNIYVCGFTVTQVGAAGPPTFKFVHGTGTNCASGTPADLSGVFSGSATAAAITTVTYGSGVGAVLVVPISRALCLTSTTSASQAGILTYAQF